VVVRVVVLILLPLLMLEYDIPGGAEGTGVGKSEDVFDREDEEEEEEEDHTERPPENSDVEAGDAEVEKILFSADRCTYHMYVFV